MCRERKQRRRGERRPGGPAETASTSQETSPERSTPKFVQRRQQQQQQRHQQQRRIGSKLVPGNPHRNPGAKSLESPTKQRDRTDHSKKRNYPTSRKFPKQLAQFTNLQPQLNHSFDRLLHPERHLWTILRSGTPFLSQDLRLLQRQPIHRHVLPQLHAQPRKTPRRL